VPDAHGAAPLRVGIVNLMPRAETYEATLLAALGASDRAIEPVWLRLTTHAYTSSDHARLEARYLPLAAALRAGRIDTLLLSGAPVEDKRFDEITYWPELSELLVEARARLPSVLGLCWGGLALAHLLGIEKVNLPTKLFGVFELENRALEHPLGRALPARFSCPQSRHSGLVDASVSDAVSSARARVLATSHETGTTILESHDGRYLMHTGHPEYEAERLAFEYHRDLAAGRSDVDRPHGFDLERPRASWQADSEAFFRAWLDAIEPP
jgi:homoserine O-succinyltransferase